VTTRAYRRPAHLVAVLALTAPMLTAVMISAAPDAFASSGGITAPSGNQVITSGSSVDSIASVSLSNHTTARLTVTGPGLGSGYTNSASYDCTSSPLNPCPSTSNKQIKVTVPVSSSTANGRFTVALSGSVTDSRYFFTNFAPLGTPSNLAAAANGRTEVDLSWSYNGAEPDKAGFEIAETHNGATRTIPVPTSVCSGATCGYALTYDQPAEATTESYSYTVTALRSSGGCGSCGDVTRGSASSSAGAQLVGPPPPPPPPSPTPTPTGGTSGSTTGTSTGGTTGTSTGGTTGTSTGGSTGATNGGSQNGGTTGTKPSGSGTTGPAAKPIVVPTLPPLVASRRSFALNFNKFSPSLGIPKLPPLPATTFPVTAGENGLGDVYQPALPYKNEGKKTTSVLSSPIAAFTESIDTDTLVKYLAMGLILFAIAAHVRLFLSHSAEE
jgi:hypothetical protein